MIILLKRIKLEAYLHDGICSTAYIKECEIFEDLQKEIDDYIHYHNNYRAQLSLKKMTSVKYRNHLLRVAQIFLKLSLTKGTF